MTRLSDDAVARLRVLSERPDLAGTRYQIVREIGRGGMGVVYEADDAPLGRRVALKIVATELSQQASARLLDEARIVARLEHPGIVPVFDAGTLPDGRPYYAMKLVRGSRLEAWSRPERGLPEILRLFVRICEPVSYAHAQGVLHRDLKPSNIMVGEFGAVLIMDWGVAVAAGSDAGVVAGTPGFMSPEQERGEPADARVDVFALGRVLKNLLEGRAEPRRLTAIVRKATEVEPAQRYQDARQMAADVERFLDGEPVAAYPENPLERALRWVSHNRTVVALVAAYLVMRVIVYFWMRL